jgi:transposase
VTAARPRNVQRDAAIIRDYQNGATQKEIATRTGITQSAVSRVLRQVAATAAPKTNNAEQRKANPERFTADGRKRRGWSPDEDFRLTNLATAGLTSYEIGEYFGLGNNTILYRMRVLGLSHTKDSLELRFQRQFVPEPNSGCWLWTGSVNANQYATIAYTGKCRLASHVSLILVGRPLAPGMCALHRCDNPPCVNPDHLFPGTRLDNNRDCIAKGRYVPSWTYKKNGGQSKWR